jgi:hypothetical protein
MMKTVLFNPFERYRVTNLLIVGVVATIAGSILAGVFSTHYDGILDTHYVMSITFYHPFLENIINVAILTILLYLVAIYLNRKTRFVDILATCLVARTPLYILPMFNINNFMGHIGSQLIQNITHHTQTFQTYDFVPLIIIGIVMILAIIWYIILLYKGFKVDTNARGSLGNVLFIIAIILAEIASKYLVTFI